jgi:hypothetical protein
MGRSRSDLLLCLVILTALPVAPAAFADADYSVADGAAELTVSVDPGEALVWMNTFPVDPAGSYIDTVRIAYGRVGGPSALNNQPVRILLYEDTNGGSPQDAVLRWSTTTVIANANTNVLNVYRLPAMLVHGSLVAGALFANGTAFSKGVGALDTTAPSFSDRSYVGFAASIDPANLGAIPAGQFGTIESFGTIGNFRCEAHGRIVDDAAVLLTVGKSEPGALVQLSWTGTQSTYDVERAGKPDFSDGTVLAIGVAVTTYDDAGLHDGKSWYYRVR